MESYPDPDVQWVINNELRLLSAEVRRCTDQLKKLLHPDFVEFGASGRRWDRSALIMVLGDEPAEDAHLTPSEVIGVRLADTVVLVTYVTERSGRRARRSSLWRRIEDGTWQLYFHQGTPIPAE